MTPRSPMRYLGSHPQSDFRILEAQFSSLKVWAQEGKNILKPKMRIGCFLNAGRLGNIIKYTSTHDGFSVSMERLLWIFPVGFIILYKLPTCLLKWVSKGNLSLHGLTFLG